MSPRKSIGCPIVGIGGSAGGFEATMELLRHLPPKSGMTFVVVQHLDPHYASKLASLLGKVSAMPVMEVTKTIEAKPNTVYVQPPNKYINGQTEPDGGDASQQPPPPRARARKTFLRYRHRVISGATK